MNNILAHVILKSFSFHFILNKKKKHPKISGIQIVLLLLLLLLLHCKKNKQKKKHLQQIFEFSKLIFVGDS